MMRKLAAEFVGTFWLVFGGCGSAILAAAFPELGIGFVGVSLAFGLTVLTMAYAVAAFPADILIQRFRLALRLARGSVGANCYHIGLRSCLARSPPQ